MRHGPYAYATLSPAVVERDHPKDKVDPFFQIHLRPKEDLSLKQTQQLFDRKCSQVVHVEEAGVTMDQYYVKMQATSVVL